VIREQACYAGCNGTRRWHGGARGWRSIAFRWRKSAIIRTIEGAVEWRVEGYSTEHRVFLIGNSEEAADVSRETRVDEARQGLAFVKMHGLGNDYVYIDRFVESALFAPAALAREMADRHRGVGGDGLILIERSMRADARMRMFNSDGSESEMCGNGVRCVAHLVVSRGYAAAGDVSIETGRGVLVVSVAPTGPRSSRVRVDMGTPLLHPDEIPVAVLGLDGRVVDVESQAVGTRAAWWDEAGLDPRMTCVSMGNPHVIYYCNNVAAVPLHEIGPQIETHALFPRRINVHFVQRQAAGRVTVRTWERGTGITQACGTGASAVCVAGVLSGRTAEQIEAELPGGVLELAWDGAGSVFMTGPAEEVFTGIWPADLPQAPNGQCGP
jgi:diaminopimelate epimerase